MSATLSQLAANDSQCGERNASVPLGEEAKQAVQQTRMLAALTRLPLVCMDLSARQPLLVESSELALGLPRRLAEELSQTTAPLHQVAGNITYFGIALPSTAAPRYAAVGWQVTDLGERPQEVVLAAAERGWSRDQLESWLKRQPYGTRPTVEALLSLGWNMMESSEREAALAGEAEYLSSEISRTYEEISLLHSLTRNLQISRAPRELAEVCLDRLQGPIDAEGTAILLQGEDLHDMSSGESPAEFLSAGQMPFGEERFRRLVSRFSDHDWSRPLVKNHTAGTLFGSEWPGLRNFILMAIGEGGHRSGWLMVCNMRDGREFGSIEASLVTSVATILGTHVRNIELYEQHEDLLISFVRSLVSSLDAKDNYTRGHSDRVALIARRLGEEIGLPPEDLHDVFVSGLLHDIGKIGVDDRILQKPGKLTDEEFAAIQQHPTIGYNILVGLRNLQSVIPGVRSHHETYDGKGYPDKLVGEEIPLMARLLAVADSYDAMRSDRPYRKGMDVERIDSIFRAGAGEQWDKKVIDAYFAARDDIDAIFTEAFRTAPDSYGGLCANRDAKAAAQAGRLVCDPDNLVSSPTILSR